MPPSIAFVDRFQLREIIRLFKTPFLWVVVAILTYFILAISNLRYPGLYYDEALFINAALGGNVTDEFVSSRIFGVPVMTMPYIGALKSLIYAPLFALLGVNIVTIRLPAIVISCFTLWLCYLVMERFLGKWGAVLSLLVLSSDPAFIFHTRLDHGPIVLMLFLKIGAVYLFLRATSTNSWKLLGGTYVCLLLGLWDKLNFVWVVISLITAAPLYKSDLVRIYLKNKIPVFVSTGLFLSGLLFSYFVLIRPVAKESLHPIENVTSLANTISVLCQASLSGEVFCTMVLENFVNPLGFSPNFLLLGSCLVLMSVVIVVISGEEKATGKQTERFKGLCFFALLFSSTIVQIALTKQARGPHHFMVLWPFHYFICALALVLIVEWKGWIGGLRTFAKSALIVGICALFAFKAYAVANVLVMFKDNETRALWSPSIYELARYLRGIAYGNARVLSVDWGVGTQVVALTDPALRAKYRDLWTMFQGLEVDGREAKWLVRLSESAPLYLVLYAPGCAVVPQARTRFFNFVRMNNLNCKRMVLVKDRREPRYEVYELGQASGPEQKQ